MSFEDVFRSVMQSGRILAPDLECSALGHVSAILGLYGINTDEISIPHEVEFQVLMLNHVNSSGIAIRGNP